VTIQEFRDQFEALGPRARAKALPGLVQELAAADRAKALLDVLREAQASPLVRAAALRLLKSFCAEDPELFQSFLSDRNPTVVKASARALKDVETLHRRAAPVARAFLKKLASVEDKDRRIKILRAVARLPAPWVQTVLIESLSDPSQHVRDFLVKDLGGRDVVNQRLLIKHLGNGPWYGKSAAIAIMGRRGSPAFLKHLASAVEDPNVDVRRSAAEALGLIGGKDSVCLLVKLVEDKNPYVKRAAEDSLRKASDPKFS
jgi:HEAT repeat protein